jgi:hypothetical protein
MSLKSLPTFLLHHSVQQTKLKSPFSQRFRENLSSGLPDFSCYNISKR